VETVLAVVCPGQGAQTPGMLSPWLEVPGLSDRLERYATITGLDLRAHGTVSDADTIRDTAIAQPLIVAASLLSLHAIFPEEEQRATGIAVTAGHSVGEFAAAAVAGVLTDEQALTLVRERGDAMAAAAAATPTGMSAVLGGDPTAVISRLTDLGLTPANVNGGGQVVAAGALEALAALAAEPPAKARVIPLQVAGAFHTAYMASAVEHVAALAAATTPRDAAIDLLSNADGQVVRDGREALTRLVAQIANPVRWDLCQESLARLGVSGMIELAPGGVLAGLAKRTLRGVETVAVKTPEDLEAAADLIARHASAGAEA
jgi:[acyl-carrier-protein] S-malonyltransferase